MITPGVPEGKAPQPQWLAAPSKPIRVCLSHQLGSPSAALARAHSSLRGTHRELNAADFGLIHHDRHRVPAGLEAVPALDAADERTLPKLSTIPQNALALPAPEHLQRDVMIALQIPADAYAPCITRHRLGQNPRCLRRIKRVAQNYIVELWPGARLSCRTARGPK
jgi:hypothetical protein